jgi:hypothetical protein
VEGQTWEEGVHGGLCKVSCLSVGAKCPSRRVLCCASCVVGGCHGCQKKKACVGHASKMPPARALKLIFHAKSLSNWDLALGLLDLVVKHPSTKFGTLPRTPRNCWLGFVNRNRHLLLAPLHAAARRAHALRLAAQLPPRPRGPPEIEAQLPGG